MTREEKQENMQGLFWKKEGKDGAVSEENAGFSECWNEIRQKLEASERQIDEGRCQDGFRHLAEIRKKVLSE